MTVLVPSAFGRVSAVLSGTVAVSNFPATQAVSGTVTANQGAAGAAAWLVDGSAHTQPISGTVGVSNFPATQPVSGTVAVSAVGGTVTVDGSGHTQPVSGTVAVSSVAGTVDMSDRAGRLVGVVSGGANTFLTDGSAHTQPVSGTVAVSTVAGTVIVDGSGVVQPVSGPLTNTQLRASAVTVDGSAVTQPVSVASLPLPSGAATESNLSEVRRSLNDVALTAILEREMIEA